MRYRAIFTTLRFDVVNDETEFGLVLAGRVGFERRNKLSDQMYLLFGPELGAGIELQSATGSLDPPYGLNASVGYVLGVQYHFGRHFFVGVETIPALSVSYTDPGIPDRDDSVVRTRLGFESLATLSAGFRF